MFVVPRQCVKNGLDRYVVLNRVARSVIESCRDQPPERVPIRRGHPVTKMYTNCARRASAPSATHYSAPEISSLIAAAECVRERESRESHELALVRPVSSA